jgi:glycerophosphoryl diester phosphodiesterase
VRIPDRPLVLGHRGAPRDAPENTLRALQVALDQGADGVELDIQPAADGTAVLIHDETLERTTDGVGTLARLTWEQISRHRAGGEPISRLEQAVQWARESGAWLNVEVKSPGIEQTAVRLAREAGILEHTFFSSFIPGIVQALRAEAPDAAVFFLTERWDHEVMEGVLAMRMDGVCLHHSIATAAALAWLRDHRLHAVVWTVDDPVRMRTLFDERVLGVITNLPALGFATLNAAGH